MDEEVRVIPVELRAEIERFDAFIAATEAAGEKFHVVFRDGSSWPEQLPAPIRLSDCAVNAYRKHSGSSFAGGHGAVFFRAMPDSTRIFRVNDENDGDPAAVRAELHRQFPWLGETPERSQRPHPETVGA